MTEILPDPHAPTPAQTLPPRPVAVESVATSSGVAGSDALSPVVAGSGVTSPGVAGPELASPGVPSLGVPSPAAAHAVGSHPVVARPLLVRAAPAALRGRIRVPGDKSISHRALMFAALAEGETLISGLLEGEDVLRTASAMRALGAAVERRTDGFWSVRGRGLGALVEPEDVLDMGNSGTAARLLAGILCSHGIHSVMTGDASLRRRPMGRVIEPLSGTGAVFAARAGGRLPLSIAGCARPMPLSVRMQVASAQVKSAVLLAGLNAAGETVVEEPVPTRDHSENMLRHFGADLRVEPAGSGRVIRLRGRPTLVARDVSVPSDPSSAAFPLVAALLVPGSAITIEAVGLNPLRTGLFDTLLEMGADLRITDRRVEGGEPVGDLVVCASALHGVVVPASRAPSMIDEYPVLAVAAAFAVGETRLCGLAELRVKESDRLAATVALLRDNNADVRVEGDDMIVAGRGAGAGPGGGMVGTLMDHRLAMSGVVMGLAAATAVGIDDVGFIDTSFPGFLALMNRLGAGLDTESAS